MKKQKLGGILALKKNVVSNLNNQNVDAGEAVGGSLTHISWCVSCSSELCCPGSIPTRDPNDSNCYCE